MKLPEKIKIAALAYWQFDKHHPIGAIECKEADVLTVTRAFMVTETEVKITMSDMRGEIKSKRAKHWYMRKGEASNYTKAHYFYFAVPEELEKKALAAIEELYPYAGLLLFKDGEINIYYPANIRMVRRAKRFIRGKMSQKELMEIASISTNTALRYARRVIDYEGYQRDCLRLTS